MECQEDVCLSVPDGPPVVRLIPPCTERPRCLRSWYQRARAACELSPKHFRGTWPQSRDLTHTVADAKVVNVSFDLRENADDDSVRYPSNVLIDAMRCDMSAVVIATDPPDQQGDMFINSIKRNAGLLPWEPICIRMRTRRLNDEPDQAGPWIVFHEWQRKELGMALNEPSSRSYQWYAWWDGGDERAPWLAYLAAIRTSATTAEVRTEHQDEAGRGIGASPIELWRDIIYQQFKDNNAAIFNQLPRDERRRSASKRVMAMVKWKERHPAWRWLVSSSCWLSDGAKAKLDQRFFADVVIHRHDNDKEHIYNARIGTSDITYCHFSIFSTEMIHPLEFEVMYIDADDGSANGMVEYAKVYMGWYGARHSAYELQRRAHEWKEAQQEKEVDAFQLGAPGFATTFQHFIWHGLCNWTKEMDFEKQMAEWLATHPTIRRTIKEQVMIALGIDLDHEARNRTRKERASLEAAVLTFFVDWLMFMWTFDDAPDDLENIQKDQPVSWLPARGGWQITSSTTARERRKRRRQQERVTARGNKEGN